jgi:hypothetical protein
MSPFDDKTIYIIGLVYFFHISKVLFLTSDANSNFS